MWLKKYNTLPEGLPPLNSSLLEDDTSWLKKYANGGRVGDPPPRKLKPNFQPKPMGYYNTLKQPEVSESTGASNPYIMDEQQNQQMLKYMKEKGDLIETIKKVNPQATHQQAVKNAESILYSANREQEVARELTPEEKAQVYELRTTRDISGAGDYWQRIKDIIWNPIDAFTYAMDDRVEMPLGLTQYKELQRKGLMPDDQVSSNAMMNSAGIASYAIPGLGLIAEGKDLYENSSAFLEDPTLANAAWLGLGAAGAKATLADQKLYGRFARNKFNKTIDKTDDAVKIATSSVDDTNKDFKINSLIENLLLEGESSKTRNLYTSLNNKLNKRNISSQNKALEEAEEFSKLYWQDGGEELNEVALKKMQNILGEPYVKGATTNIKKLSEETKNVMVDPYSTEINKLSKSEKDYVKKNPLSIGGVNFAYVDDGGSSITLRNNLPFLYISPKGVGGIAIHEDGHTKQLIQIGDQTESWADKLSKFDPSEAPYYTYADTELGQRYKKAMIEINPKAQEKYKEEFLDPKRAGVTSSTKREAYLHDATPIELHSDLMKTRFEYYKKLIKKGVSKKEAVKIVREDSPEFIDYAVKTKNIKKFFKKETSVEEIKKLIKILPGALPFILGVGSSEQTKEAKTGGWLKDY